MEERAPAERLSVDRYILTLDGDPNQDDQNQPFAIHE